MNKSKKKPASRNSYESLCKKRDRALERVLNIWLRDDVKDPEELNKALDVLTIAHTKSTFEASVGVRGVSSTTCASPTRRPKVTPLSGGWKRCAGSKRGFYHGYHPLRSWAPRKGNCQRNTYGGFDKFRFREPGWVADCSHGSAARPARRQSGSFLAGDVMRVARPPEGCLEREFFKRVETTKDANAWKCWFPAIWGLCH